MTSFFFVAEKKRRCVRIQGIFQVLPPFHSSSIHYVHYVVVCILPFPGSSSSWKQSQTRFFSCVIPFVTILFRAKPDKVLLSCAPFPFQGRRAAANRVAPCDTGPGGRGSRQLRAVAQRWGHVPGWRLEP